MNEVLRGLEMIADTFDKQQDEDAIIEMYNLVEDTLTTEEQKEALYYGALTLFAIISKMRVKEKHHAREFRKALRKLA